MPRNSSGNYTLPAGNPVVPNTLIETAWANPTMADIGSSLTDSLDRQGRGAMLAPLKLTDGTVGAPSLSFSSESISGIYKSASNALSISIAGVLAATFAAAGITFAKPVTASGGIVISGGQIVVPAGSAAAPSIVPTGDLNNGWWFPAADTQAWSTAGVERQRISTTNITTTLAALGPDGTAALPAWSFSADPDTGVFRTGANGIGLSAGGSSRLQATATAVASLVPHQFPDGSAAAPSITFSTDTDTGLFSNAANVLGFAIAGVEHATLTTISFTKIASAPSLTSPNSNYDDLTISSNNNSGLSIISGTAAIGGIMFQDSTDGGLAGRLQYSHAADTLTLYAGNSVGITLGAATLDTPNAITSSSTARFGGSVYGTLGVRQGGAYGGAGPTSTIDDLVIENSGSAGITILTPNTAVASIAFGDPESSLIGRIRYDHTTNVMELFAGGVSALDMSATEVSVNVALTSDSTARFNGSVYGLLGIRDGGAYGGAGPNTNVDGFVLEANGNTGFSLLTPNTATAQIRFGDPEANTIGGFSYAHTTDTLSIAAGGVSAISVTSSSVGYATGVDVVLSVSTGPTSIGSMGFRGVPQNSRSANYTLVLEDAGKHIYHPSGGGAGDVFTIPANSSVAYPIGTAVTFVNLDSNSISIAITTDTLTMAGAGSTGTRTLAQYGIATAIKYTATAWLISGTNLT